MQSRSSHEGVGKSAIHSEYLTGGPASGVAQKKGNSLGLISGCDRLFDKCSSSVELSQSVAKHFGFTTDCLTRRLAELLV